MVKNRLTKNCPNCKKHFTANVNSRKYCSVKCRKEYNSKPNIYKFNMTQNEYKELIKKQKNKCAICNEKETALDQSKTKSKQLSIDHNHKTNQVRGLLCHRCNHLIGFTKDSPFILSGAVIYLHKHKNYNYKGLNILKEKLN